MHLYRRWNITPSLFSQGDGIWIRLCSPKDDGIMDFLCFENDTSVVLLCVANHQWGD
jgi:hypothetical protein